ncbi:MAG: hypothetical protein ACETVZ_00560 [Phycisphaerae bacterium]
MPDFDTYVQKQQINWRLKHIKCQEQGEQNGKKRPWILPRRLWQKGLWPGIRSGSGHPLPDYLEKNNIDKHIGVHNLKSSWVLCTNLYFPFQRDHDMVTGFLREKLYPLIKSVDKIELEYAEEPPLDPQTLLGEPDVGKRGKNQTSPDVAFVVNGNKGLILTENKFTEHSFYECSGRKKEYGNPDIKRCLDFEFISSDIVDNCYQLNWEDGRRKNRKYWDYIRISDKGQQTLRRCPAAISGYQLFRQQSLAEAIAKLGKYEFVISCVAYDERNKTLVGSLSGTGINDFTKDWACLFEGKAKFATFTHQQWVDWVRKNDNQGRWEKWLEYIEQRYGY